MLSPDYLDAAIGIPVALILCAYWAYLSWKDRHRGNR